MSITPGCPLRGCTFHHIYPTEYRPSCYICSAAVAPDELRTSPYYPEPFSSESNQLAHLHTYVHAMCLDRALRIYYQRALTL